MTVSGSTYKNTYTLDSSTTTFPYSFKISTSVDLLVERYYSTDDTTTTVSSDDYTVTGAGEDSGTRNIEYAGAAGYGATYQLILSSNAGYTQPTDYIEGDDFAAETHEEALDRIVILTKQLKEEVNRAIRVDKNLTNPTELSQITQGWLWTDGTNWSIVDSITSTTTTYAGGIDKGADASKSATPSAGDIYVATDTRITYFCYVASTWVPHYSGSIVSGGTMTITDSSFNTIMTLDESGNLKIKGNVETDGTF